MSQKKALFPMRSVFHPVFAVPFRSNRLQQANSFRRLENSADASRSIDQSVDLSIYKIYTRARESRLNGRNGTVGMG